MAANPKAMDDQSSIRRILEHIENRTTDLGEDPTTSRADAS